MRGAAAPSPNGFCRRAHARVRGGVGEQARGGGDDGVALRADQLGGAGLERLGALGGVAHHQHRHAERRRFLLQAAGVGEDQVGAPHQVDERQVVERRR